MKFFRYISLFAVLFLAFFSCSDKEKNIWDISVKDADKPAAVTDISKEYYDTSVNLAEFKQKYPWFQGTVDDEEFELRRMDSTEVSIYKEAISKIDVNKLSKDLGALFAHIKHYYPDFPEPKTYLYSSTLQGALDPVFLSPERDFLFIDITGFMGENNAHYKGLDQYIQRTMNPVNIVPKVSELYAAQLVPFNGLNNKFLDHMIYNGKIMTLQDAFLPNYPDYLKMQYTDKQQEWAVANEANIWNYFVENDLIFSDDAQLVERFIKPGPFSKFYTEIDNQSSPKAGVFSGWQISRKFFHEKPNTELQKFLQMSAQDIFNQSNYKPKD